MMSICMIAINKAMPPQDVTNEDLTGLISVLCKKLNWIEENADDFEQKTSTVAGWRHHSAVVTALQEIFWTEQV